MSYEVLLTLSHFTFFFFKLKNYGIKYSATFCVWGGELIRRKIKLLRFNVNVHLKNKLNFQENNFDNKNKEKTLSINENK